MECSKMKEKLDRLKQHKFRVNVEFKICKNCGREYTEKENFNWSCRTHSSEYNLMWWCCGKERKDTPGCNISKHLCKEDDEDEEQQVKVRY